MKNNKIYLLGACLLCAVTTFAQNVSLQPPPQQLIVQNKTIDLPAVYQLNGGEEANPHAVKVLKELLSGKQSSKKGMLISIGEKGDKSVRKYSRQIPDHKEGYYLSVNEKEIVLAGNDERGTYYALQTFAQLLKDGKLPEVEIKDYPSVRYRGVVEGFYGTPWSHQARLSQLKFYGKNKMNTYIYGPKDDPYHSAPNWRLPYPDKEAAQLQELVAVANENEVDFVWAIHPGQDIKWNKEDRDLLLAKFEKMYQLGVRSFAVFFDDISGEGTNPQKQAELLNYIDEKFAQVKPDINQLVMCPTEYNKSWSNPNGNYLTTLGDKLNPSIQIMWTGDRVISDITRDGISWINERIKRPAYIWWNFPVSDYVRDHLLMGPVYGNGLDIKDDMSAFVSNPMERAEASKIALYSVADYAWNLEKYDSNVSWKRAIRDLMPNHAAYLETFAAHNSDLGENGHGFRRDESVALQPALKSLLAAYEKNGGMDEAAYKQVAEECDKIIVAADRLLASKESRELIEEIKPWLMQFKLIGEYGREVLKMVRLQKQGGQEFVAVHDHAQALQTLMYEVDATYNQNPYQPGVKGGSKYLLPTFNSLFETSTQRYNKAAGTTLDSRAVYMPYTLSSNVKQLALLPMRQKGKGGNVSPSNEVIIWQAGGEVAVAMDYVRTLESLLVDLGTQGAEKNFRLEISADGVNWKTVDLRPVQGRTLLSAEVSGMKVLKIRFTNVSGSEQKVYFKQFRFVEQ